MKLKDLVVEIRADQKKLINDLKQVDGRAKQTAGTMQKAFNAINFRNLLYGSFGLYAVQRIISKVGGSFIDAASEMEQYKIRLEVLTRSQAEGARMFELMTTYASKVPFTYKDIISSATQLSGVMQGNVDKVNEWIPLIGDLAAATGLSIEQTTSQVSRMYSAGAAAADMFRERGITAMLGFQYGVSYTAEETRKMLMESWTKTDSNFKGATDKLAKSWSGLMSFFSDKWLIFRNMVMEAGLFDYIKTKLTDLLNNLNKLQSEGKLQEWATTFSDKIVTGFEKIADRKNDIIAVFNAVSVTSKLLGMSASGWGQMYSYFADMIKEDYEYQKELYGITKNKYQKPPTPPYLTGNTPLMFQQRGMGVDIYGKTPEPAPSKASFGLQRNQPESKLGYSGFDPKGFYKGAMALPPALNQIKLADKETTSAMAEHWDRLGWTMQDSWANTMQSFIQEGMNFKSFATEMFNDVSNAFIRMVAQIAAEGLFENTFGKMGIQTNEMQATSLMSEILSRLNNNSPAVSTVGGD